MKDILGWSLEALEADAIRFRSVYLPVPILPPDQYGALIVQLTEGCSYNQCTFCRFYRDRPFRAKTSEELRAHLRAVREFFGEGLRLRRSVFLADANALVLPPARLVDAFDLLHAELPLGPGALRGVYSFRRPGRDHRHGRHWRRPVRRTTHQGYPGRGERHGPRAK